MNDDQVDTPSHSHKTFLMMLGPGLLYDMSVLLPNGPLGGGLSATLGSIYEYSSSSPRPILRKLISTEGSALPDHLPVPLFEHSPEILCLGLESLA